MFVKLEDLMYENYANELYRIHENMLKDKEEQRFKPIFTFSGNRSEDDSYVPESTMGRMGGYGGKRKSKKKQYYNIKKGKRTFHNTRHRKISYYMMGGEGYRLFEDTTREQVDATRAVQLINLHDKIWKTIIDYYLRSNTSSNCNPDYIDAYIKAKDKWESAKSKLVKLETGASSPVEAPPTQPVEQVELEASLLEATPTPTVVDNDTGSLNSNVPTKSFVGGFRGGKSRRKKSRKTKSRKRKTMKRRR